jgi:hypothetical protein
VTLAIFHLEKKKNKKKNSRSKSFGERATSSSSSSAPKRPHYSSELRGMRILEVEKDLNDLTTHLQFAEKLREKFANVQQYEATSSICKEVSTMKAEKRKLQAELHVSYKAPYFYYLDKIRRYFG